jgi:hypothetical protein
MLHNVATTFLHGQISNVTRQLIHYSGCCPFNFEAKNKLNNIVPARTEIISCIMQKSIVTAVSFRLDKNRFKMEKEQAYPY